MNTIDKSVSGVVLESRDGYLMFGTSTIFNGKLIIPGGGIKPGETAHEAAVRELKEELAIDISPYQYHLIADHRTGKTTKLVNGEWKTLNLKFYDFHVILEDKLKEEIDIIAESDFKEPQWIHKSAVDRDAISPPTVWLLEQIGYLKEIKT